jgi:glycosyltransferase involved in cell wall biosynthesis
MVNVISISTDRKVFEEGSLVRSRVLAQRELFSELHVIVFTLRGRFSAEQLGNLWLYPTNSISRWFYVRDAISLARALALQRNMHSSAAVITAQDPFECGFAGYVSAHKAKLPLHVQIHTDFLSPFFRAHSLLNRLRVLVARFVLARTCGIRVVSERIRESLERSTIRIKAPISVLPVFSAQAVAYATKPLRRLQKEQDALCRVLSLGRLKPEKDFPLALRSIERAHETLHSITLLVVGEGSEEKNIRDEIAGRGLQDVVRLKKWQSDVSPFYPVSDIVLVTSRFEGFGLVLLEAAASGVPIVTTDVGIAHELIPSPYERFICPVGDADGIARCLLELAENPLLRLAYSKALRSNAKQFIISEDTYWQQYRADILRCIKPL